MALERKDVRFYMDADQHAALTRICNLRGITIADFVEKLVVPAVLDIGHEAIQLADELRGLGIFRKTPDSSGEGRK